MSKARPILIWGMVALPHCNAHSGNRPPVAPAATVVGQPQSCIPLRQPREARIRDDWTIDFVGNGIVWRNPLPDACPGLKANDAFSFETSLNELCNTDIIYVVQKLANRAPGPACALGMFAPVKLAK